MEAASWHVHGSPDKRFAVEILRPGNSISSTRETDEMILLTAGHKTTAARSCPPYIQPGWYKNTYPVGHVLSEDNRSMNICIVRTGKNG
jgi:oligogalacturonide lyase